MSGPWAGRRLHLLGIGGAGMSGCAAVAAELGATVSGSDRAATPVLERLRAAGIDARPGHDAANLPGGKDVEVVYSTAVPAENPELARARERGLRVMRARRAAARAQRAEADDRRRRRTREDDDLEHGGAHPARLRPGARVSHRRRAATTGRNAAWGTGEWLVVEADESDRSMLSLVVEVAVVTNVELDHHATYGSLAEVREVFRSFLAGPAQAVILDRPELLELRDGPCVAFDAPAGAVLEPGGSRFRWRDAEVHLRVPGEHNVRNAVAALEAAALAGVAPAQAAAALATFAGAGRRFETLGATASGARVVRRLRPPPDRGRRDARRRAARSGPRRVVAVFQPHLYSRTQHLASAFGRALAAADLACVLDVYPRARARRGLPGGQRAARRRGRRRRGARPRGAVAARVRRRRARAARAPARRRPVPRARRRRRARARRAARGRARRLTQPGEEPRRRRRRGVEWPSRIRRLAASRCRVAAPAACRGCARALVVGARPRAARARGRLDLAARLLARARAATCTITGAHGLRQPGGPLRARGRRARHDDPATSTRPQLRAAVARYPLVKDVEARADLPARARDRRHRARAGRASLERPATSPSPTTAPCCAASPPRGCREIAATAPPGGAAS